MDRVIVKGHPANVNVLLSLVLAHRVSDCSHGSKSVLGMSCLDAPVFRLKADNGDLIFNRVV